MKIYINVSAPAKTTGSEKTKGKYFVMASFRDEYDDVFMNISYYDDIETASKESNRIKDIINKRG